MIISNLEHLETVEENAVQGGQVELPEAFNGAFGASDATANADGNDFGASATETFSNTVADINDKRANVGSVSASVSI